MHTILVTGGSGFVGSHCIVAALAAGHRVRTTVRSLDKVLQVRAMLAEGGIDDISALTFYAADLERDDGWEDAVSGCDYVLHTASPFPPVQPEDADALIVPARDGALRVLAAARRAGVRGVVLTSSFGAVGYGPDMPGHVYTEADWTPLDTPNQPYILSKTIAERAAWDFVGSGEGPELSVINPTGIFGPALGPQLSASVGMIKGLLEGAFPAELPELWFGVVDVRDVVDLHLRAMTAPAAAGERFIAVSGAPLSLLNVATILREAFGNAAVRVPSRGSAGPSERGARPASSAKAASVLGWSPRSSREAVIASAESLLRNNFRTSPA